MTTPIEIVDTAVKIGLGAIISGVVTYWVTRSKNKHDLKKTVLENKLKILREVSELVEESTNGGRSCRTCIANAICARTSPIFVKTAIDYFLDYYITNEAQWRMITHFALHGNKDMGSVDKLNEIGREFMDVFETIFVYAGCKTDTRLMAHTLFSCLSGVLIAFRNYPGRSEKERTVHMKRIGSVIESMIIALINQ